MELEGLDFVYKEDGYDDAGGHWVVYTFMFVYPDHDCIEVAILDAGDHYLITDNGETDLFFDIHGEDDWQEKKKNALDSYGKIYGLEVCDGALQMKSRKPDKGNRLGTDVAWFLQIITALTWGD